MKVSNNVADGAKSRIEESEGQRARVLAAVAKGNPLSAEPDEERKLARLQRVAGVAPEAAARIIKGLDPADLGLTEERRLGAERIWGKTTDFVGISFLELARMAANAVGRVVYQRGEAHGSGFLVSNRLFLTNNHVIPSAEDANEFRIEFNYEKNIDGQPVPVTRFAFDPETFFLTSSEDKLDYTLVAVGPLESGPGDLADFGYCPLLDAKDKHSLGEYVNIVQHPEGDYKQVVLRENRLVSRLDTVLHYLADTLGGASGSPVFNDQWEVIALHHWGEPFTETQHPDGQPVELEVNEGVRISAIIKDLKRRSGGLHASRKALLAEAVKPTERRPPSREESRRLSVLDAAEAVRVDRDYENRNGYNPSFLPGHVIPLPKLSQEHQTQAAKATDAAQDADPYELRYQHFSVVVDAPRRSALFTAVNIDGSTLIDVDRKSGEPRESAEARERWFEDPRIDQNAQLDQKVFDDQGSQRIFDRGHLVRRQDPNWWTPSRARRANADTFHFTNCSLQESELNQSDKLWLGVENWILDTARADRERVSVFTGPVLDPDDPLWQGRDIQVPMRFWKIVIRVENEQLAATAFLLEQPAWLPEVLRGAENARQPVTPETIVEHQVRVSEVTRLTELDFGVLANHDTLEGGTENARRQVKRFADINF